jgi:hypothetical protein
VTSRGDAVTFIICTSNNEASDRGFSYNLELLNRQSSVLTRSVSVETGSFSLSVTDQGPFACFSRSIKHTTADRITHANHVDSRTTLWSLCPRAAIRRNSGTCRANSQMNAQHKSTGSEWNLPVTCIRTRQPHGTEVLCDERDSRHGDSGYHSVLNDVTNRATISWRNEIYIQKRRDIPLRRRGCHIVSLTDRYGGILGSLDRSR